MDACHVDPDAAEPAETELGRDFNRVHDADTVHWWINRHAELAPRVKDRVQELIPLVVGLKRDAAAFSPPPNVTYSRLVQLLAAFSSDHARELFALRDFVEWLNALDPHAPSMLFTTRVWSQSGRIDRSPGPLRDRPAGSDAELRLRVATETALGLWGRTAPLADELLPDGQGPEGSCARSLTGTPDDSDADDYVREVVDRVLRSFREYFADMRRAVENVSMECTAVAGRAVLAGDEAFWKMVVHELRGSDRTETDLWDVKRTLEFWELRGDERARAEVRFCCRLAAFANARGGAILIGISDFDGLSVTGLHDVDSKVEATRHAIERWTTLSAAQVKLVPIPVEMDGGIDTTCLAVAVARTRDLTEVRDVDGTVRWPVRVDSRTRYLTRDDLEGQERPREADDFSFTDVLHRSFRGEDDRQLLSEF